MCSNPSKMFRGSVRGSWIRTPMPIWAILCERFVFTGLFRRWWMCPGWTLCEFNLYENLLLWCSLSGWWILWKRWYKWRSYRVKWSLFSRKLINDYLIIAAATIYSKFLFSGCRRDTNCPFGQVCQIDSSGINTRGKCEPGCHFNNDCTMGTACINGNCTNI